MKKNKIDYTLKNKDMSLLTKVNRLYAVIGREDLIKENVNIVNSYFLKDINEFSENIRSEKSEQNPTFTKLLLKEFISFFKSLFSLAFSGTKDMLKAGKKGRKKK